MSRIAGRAGRIYTNLTSGGTAEPLAYLKSWSLDFSTGKIDVTAMGDTTMIYVSGLPDAQGQMDGFYDNATVQTYTAATDGQPRKFYLYPDIATSQYFFGTVLWDLSINADVADAVAISGGFAASSIFAKVG